LDPQTAFAHAHIPNLFFDSLISERPTRPESHNIARTTPLLSDWDGALRAEAVTKEDREGVCECLCVLGGYMAHRRTAP
jgi:hypothetical protein